MATPHNLSFTSIFYKCKSILQFKQAHAQLILKRLHHPPSSLRPIISFSALHPSGDIHYALLVLLRTPTRPTVFLFNTVIRGLARSHRSPVSLSHSILVFNRMGELELAPNNYTFTFLFQVCANLVAFDLGCQFHGMVVKKILEKDSFIRNSIIRFYAVCGNLRDARRVFDQSMEVDVVSWNSLINGYIGNGFIEEALGLFEEMPERNVISCNSMIGGLVKLGRVDEACRVFREMHTRNLVTWVVMISGFAQNGRPMDALTLFREMQLLDIEPSAAILVSVLSACSQLGSLVTGNWICCYIRKCCVQIDSILSAALIDMYAKCGNIKLAMQVFLSSREKDVSTYTTMISGLAINGKSEEALWLFEKMCEDFVPDRISYMAVLCACSHKGWVEKGFHYFNAMVDLHGIKPELDHYACMVDLLGRAGLLEEAERFISIMPMEPDNVIWGSLLGACRIHGNAEMGERVGSFLIESDQCHDGRYVLLSNIYAKSNKGDDIEEVQKTMKRRMIKRTPGCSSIEVDGVVHEFVAGDSSHDLANEIHKVWEDIEKEIRKFGYTPGTGEVVFDVEEEEKESVIGYHSEKLAISFGFISTKPGSILRIMKNIRICRDCHSAIKLVSMVFRRKIVVRDRKQFHHFEGGSCSCLDFW